MVLLLPVGVTTLLGTATLPMPRPRSQDNVSFVTKSLSRIERIHFESLSNISEDTLISVGRIAYDQN